MPLIAIGNNRNRITVTVMFNLQVLRDPYLGADLNDPVLVMIYIGDRCIDGLNKSGFP